MRLHVCQRRCEVQHGAEAWSLARVRLHLPPGGFGLLSVLLVHCVAAHAAQLALVVRFVA
jgi:hypothetical protein